MKKHKCKNYYYKRRYFGKKLRCSRCGEVIGEMDLTLEDIKYDFLMLLGLVHQQPPYENPGVLKNKDREIKKLISDIQAIAVRNPTDKMTWRKIGEFLYNNGWRKTFAEREEYKITEDDVETAFLMLTNFADELAEGIDKEENFVSKTDWTLKHLEIYQIYRNFKEDNENGEYESIWKKFKKSEGK